jgi:hypothetical protein
VRDHHHTKGFIMKFTTARSIASAILVFVTHAVLAAPGTPIGGIIVKGGKNPGGQMLVLATTDAGGNFTIEFTEGGEYKLEFEAKSAKEFGERVKAGMQMDYVIKTKENLAGTDSQRQASEMSRHTPFHNKIENARVVVTVPHGGGAIRGVLQALNPSGSPAEKAIDQSGVSVKSDQPKGGIKR